MAFVTNDTVTENVDELQDLVDSNLGDLKTYLSNTASVWNPSYLYIRMINVSM